MARFLKLSLLFFPFTLLLSCQKPTETVDLSSIKPVIFDATDSVAYLINKQNESGLWNEEHMMNGPAPLAVSALCARALLEWRPADPQAVDTTLKKMLPPAIKRLKNSHKGGLLGNNAWGQLYMLELFLKLKEDPHWKSQRQDWDELVNLAIKKLMQTQKPGGRWGYNSSWQVAATLIGMMGAKTLGFKIPDKNFSAAVKILEKSRIEIELDDKYYQYYRYQPFWRGSKLKHDDWVNQNFSTGALAYEAMAGRISVCALASFITEKIDREKLGDALHQFMSTRDLMREMMGWPDPAGKKWDKAFVITRNRGRVTPPRWYVHFAWNYSARAFKDLGNDWSTLQANIIAHELLAAREKNGTWINVRYLAGEARNELRTYGTAMALITMTFLKN